MIRSQQYLENVSYVRVKLDTPIELPQNNQFQTKRGYKFTLNDRNNFYDWYNYKFEAKANGADIGADTQSAPINGSFSLIKSLKISSAGKKMYEADNIHKGIFIKNLLDFSDDYSRSVAGDSKKLEFYYRLNEAANAQDYTIFALVLSEKEFELKQISNELVVV